jgi:site-specific recombinase XerD
MICKEAVKRFLTNLQAQGLSPLTIRNYQWDLSHFLKSFAFSNVSEITSNDVSEFLAARSFSSKNVLNKPI